MFQSIKGNDKDVKKQTLDVTLKKKIFWCTYDNVQEEIKWKRGIMVRERKKRKQELRKSAEQEKDFDREGGWRLLQNDQC